MKPIDFDDVKMLEELNRAYTYASLLPKVRFKIAYLTRPDVDFLEGEGAIDTATGELLIDAELNSVAAFLCNQGKVNDNCYNIYERKM